MCFSENILGSRAGQPSYFPCFNIVLLIAVAPYGIREGARKLDTCVDG